MIDKTKPDMVNAGGESAVLTAPRVWASVRQLIQHGCYEQLLELLTQTKPADGDLLSDGLLVARQFAYLCQQSQVEAEWYQRLAEKARRVEQEFSQQLEQLLDRLSERKSPQPGVPRGGVQPAAVSPKIDPRPNPLAISVPPTLKIRCFGAFQALINGQPITDWPSLKARSIFKYLVTRHPNPIGKETLMAVFWPEAEPNAARRNLHQAIYSLRTALKAQGDDFPYILFDNDSYALNAEIAIWLDSVEFEQQVQAGRWLEHAGQPLEAMQEYCAAETLYRGDFLEEDLYEDWTRAQREHLWNTYLDVTDNLSESFFMQGHYIEAVRLSQKILQRDNCHEGAHRRLMKCYQQQGQRHLAVRQYQCCVQTLEEELGVAPSPETETLFRQLVDANGTLVPTQAKVPTV